MMRERGKTKPPQRGEQDKTRLIFVFTSGGGPAITNHISQRMETKKLFYTANNRFIQAKKNI